MSADNISQIETLLERKLSEEEIARLRRIKDVLKIPENDALWDIIVALEYQHAYYEELPQKIAGASAEILHGISVAAEKETAAMQPVTFRNQYKMDIAGNLFLPRGMDQNTKHAAIGVGHPMGAVKEQSANLYATNMAEQGFVTLSVDLAFWGGSAGEHRNAVSPDLYAETFSAAVDYLGTRPFVDRERIGVIGICGSGSFAISAAKIDPRLKAIATVSMYNMGNANRYALNKS